MYTPIGAQKLESNGWASFGLYISLEIAENAWPKQNYKTAFYVKWLLDTNKWAIKITEGGEVFSIEEEPTSDDLDHIESVLDSIFKRNVSDSLTLWLKS